MKMNISKDNVLNTLSEEQKSALVELAMETAAAEGYCEESYNVLEIMGLNVQEKEVEVNLKFKVYLKPGQTVSVDCSDFDFRDASYNCVDIVDIEFVSTSA